MPSKRVNKNLNGQAYFLTFTIRNWLYILDRHNRWDILLESLKFCKSNKNMKLFAFVFMANHIHLIVQCPDMAGFIRSFKTHTSKSLVNNIRRTEPTLIKLFLKNAGRHSVWEKTNMPKIVMNNKFFLQKKQYIENNPVRRRYVELPEHWIYSSAHKPCLIEIDE